MRRKNSSEIHVQEDKNSVKVKDEKTDGKSSTKSEGEEMEVNNSGDSMLFLFIIYTALQRAKIKTNRQ